MYRSGNANLRDYGDYITHALQTEGGHLSLGRGAFILYFGRSARFSGYGCEHVKACCIAAGLPVIDSRMVAFEDVVRLAVVDRWSRSAMRQARRPIMRSPSPRSVWWRKPYRAAGAEVFNLPDLAKPAPEE